MHNSSALFSPLKLRSVELRNRIAVSPMCMYSSKDGYATNWHLVHLGTRAVGGAGLIICEATAVSPEGRITPDDLGIWKDDHVTKLSEIVNFLKEQGSTPGIQLAHAGRKASTTNPWKGGKVLKQGEGGWTTFAPSSIPFFGGNPAPVALDKAGLAKVIGDFRSAAKRSLSAGFEVLEIHAAHGYLLHEFLSPLSNTRIDDYGGSFENRTRLLIQVITAIREVWPLELPLLVRISATDWVKGGWNETESVQLGHLLKERGVDLIDCSSGGLIPNVTIPVTKGYQVGFARKIKQEAQILSGAVGLITSADQAEDILQNKQADLIFLGRELLRNPYFPLEAARKLGVEINWPSQYKRAQR